MSEAPAAYAVFADNGNIRMWWSHPLSDHAKDYARRNSLDVVPLYLHPAPADPAVQQECLAEDDAAKQLLFWWADQLATAAPAQLPEVVRDGYSRIMNLASAIKPVGFSVVESGGK